MLSSVWFPLSLQLYKVLGSHCFIISCHAVDLVWAKVGWDLSLLAVPRLFSIHFISILLKWMRHDGNLEWWVKMTRPPSILIQTSHTMSSHDQVIGWRGPSCNAACLCNRTSSIEDGIYWMISWSTMRGFLERILADSKLRYPASMWCEENETSGCTWLCIGLVPSSSVDSKWKTNCKRIFWLLSSFLWDVEEVEVHITHRLKLQRKKARNSDILVQRAW